MKVKLLITIFSVCFSIFLVNAEQPGSSNKKFDKCGTLQYIEYLKTKYPSYEQQLAQSEIEIQQVLNNTSNTRLSNTVYTIPVVVHIVYNTAGQNISDAQVQSQIDVLNEDFSRTNADKVNTPSAFASVASATNFQFCLARRDTNNLPTNGIERRQTTVQTFPTNDDVKFYSSGGLNAWNVNKYLNIWVCELGGIILGYGEPPANIHTNTFGVVIQYNTFGRTGVVIPPYNLGRTCTHEISHCFNLLHVFGNDAQCGPPGDYVNDTPDQDGATYGCYNFPHVDVCSPNSPGIMFMNYMDYTDDNCMNMFSAGQASRMFASINSMYNSLFSSNGCLVNGIESPSDFELSIYPNPTPGILNLDMFTTKNIGSKVNIRITDVFGKVVHESVIQNPNGFVHQLDLQNLNSGIYFVSIYNDNYKRTEKISLSR